MPVKRSKPIVAITTVAVQANNPILFPGMVALIPDYPQVGVAIQERMWGVLLAVGGQIVVEGLV